MSSATDQLVVLAGRLEQVQALVGVLALMLWRKGAEVEPEARLAQATNSILVDLHEDTLHGVEL